MHLSLNQFQEIKQICNICNRSLEDHAPDCPQGKLKEVGIQIIEHLMTCPKCYESGSVLPNRDDFLECQECHALFTRSLLAMGHDPDTLERTMIFKGDDGFQVLVIPEEGKGDFPLLQRAKELRKLCDELKKEKSDE